MFASPWSSDFRTLSKQFAISYRNQDSSALDPEFLDIGIETPWSPLSNPSVFIAAI